MKRFFLFAFLTYYPSGGMGDFIDSFDDLKVMHKYVRQELRNQDNIQVYDSQRNEIIDYEHILINCLENYLTPDSEEFSKRAFKSPRCTNCYHNDPDYVGASDPPHKDGLKLKCLYCGNISEKK